MLGHAPEFGGHDAETVGHAPPKYAPVIAACLHMMLMTGARPGEMLALRWEGVNTQWKGISIRD